VIWYNDALYDTSIVTFDLSDRGLLLADGLFETMVVFGGVAFRLADHLDRLMAAAESIGLAIDRNRLEAAIAALVPQARGGGVLRLTVTRGAAPRGLIPPATGVPTVLAAITEWPRDVIFNPVELALTSIRRNPFSPLSRIKSLAYLDNVLGLQDARRQGADDALFLNVAGSVACASAGNIFALRGDSVVTPPIADGVLPGITRGLILSIGKNLGLKAKEATLTLDELHRAEAVFITNSVRLVSPVHAICGAPLPHTGRPAEEILRHLAALIEGECGANPLK